MHSSNSRSPSKTRTASIGYANGFMSPHPLKADAMSLERNQSGSVTSSGSSSKKKKAPKPYEPIRLSEDILTIQAHTCSTPVTELPYLLIAAHIGALPTTRQFYPATSSSHTPLTIFRDMFVMTVDVRGYKQSSVRLSTEGHLIIIECLQSELPQVVHTQTGTVDAQDKYVMDPTPKLNSMPIHTSFNYVQHRVKLPDDFAEEGLKVGMDEVSGHVIITGRLVHNQNSNFPEPWNKNKVVKKGRGPIINTSSLNLSREDARKLAAWQAVQGKSREKSMELTNTSLLQYGKKQWLEKEGAKLRSIQHKALKTNIKKLTELRKNCANSSSVTTTATTTTITTEKSSDVNLKAQAATTINQNLGGQQQQQLKMPSQGGEEEELLGHERQIMTHDHLAHDPDQRTSGTKLINDPFHLLQADPSKQNHVKGGNVVSSNEEKNDKVKGKESRAKVSFQSDNGGGGLKRGGGNLTKKKSKMDAEVFLKKKSLNKLSDSGGGGGGGGGKNEKGKDKKKSKTTDDPENNKIRKKRTNKTAKADTIDSAPDLTHPIKEQFRSSINISSGGGVAVQNLDQFNPHLFTFNQNSYDSAQKQLIQPESLNPHSQIGPDQTNTVVDLASANNKAANGFIDPLTSPPLNYETITSSMHGGESSSFSANPNQQNSPSTNGARTQSFDLETNQDLSHKHFDQTVSDQGVTEALDQSTEVRAQLEVNEGVKLDQDKLVKNEEDPIGQHDKKMWETLLQMAVSSSAKTKREKGSKSPSLVRS